MKKFAALLLTLVMLLSLSRRPAEGSPETQIDKALALIGTFASGDTELAASLLDENYIQHNLAYGTGRDAFIASVEGLAAAETPTTVQNIRAFEDGEYVFLHTIYNFVAPASRMYLTYLPLLRTRDAEHRDNGLRRWSRPPCTADRRNHGDYRP